MVHRRKVNKVITIGDLFKINEVPEEENAEISPSYDIKVKTPYGYYNIESMFRTEKQKSITVYFKNGSTLKCSNHHRLMTDDGWKEINELSDTNRIFTDVGTTSLLKIVEHDEEILYDISVETVHCYYSNSILSHNSWSLAAIGAHAAKQGKKVLHVTLELLETYTLQRYDSVITGIHFTDLKYNLDSVEAQVGDIKGNINVKYYPSKRATINTIQSYVESLRGDGFNPDMIILDYADKLKYTSNAKSNDASDLGNLYDEVKGLAGELKVPIWTASQTNKDGLSGDIIEAGSASRSFEKLFVADFIMSIQRKPEDKLNGTARAHIIKNRYGADGMTFPSKFNANNGNIILYNDSSLEGKSLKENMNKGDVGVKNYLSGQYKLLMNKED